LAIIRAKASAAPIFGRLAKRPASFQGSKPSGQEPRQREDHPILVIADGGEKERVEFDVVRENDRVDAMMGDGCRRPPSNLHSSAVS